MFASGHEKHKSQYVLINPNSPPTQQARGLAITSIRQHAVELARDEINGDIQELGGMSDPGDKAQAKEGVVRKLKRLLPGEPTGLNTMKDSAGTTVTDPEEIAQVLKQHWGGVFSEKTVQHTALQIWLGELFIKNEQGCFITGLPAGSNCCWVVRRKHVASAIASSKASMPGPDGIMW